MLTKELKNNRNTFYYKKSVKNAPRAILGISLTLSQKCRSHGGGVVVVPTAKLIRYSLSAATVIIFLFFLGKLTIKTDKRSFTKSRKPLFQTVFFQSDFKLLLFILLSNLYTG